MFFLFSQSSLNRQTLTTLDSNKADLAIINRIRAEIKPSQPSSSSSSSSNRRLLPAAAASERDYHHHSVLTRQPQSQSQVQQQRQQQQQPKEKAKRRWRLALNAVRCVVRMQIGARAWGEKDRVRRRLADCFDGMQREQRIRAMREVWRREVGKRVGSTGGRQVGEGGQGRAVRNGDGDGDGEGVW